MMQVAFARRTGMQIGSNVYVDAEWAGEQGVTYGNNATADRGAIVYGHMLHFNGLDNVLQFRDVVVGSNVSVGPRAAIMPGAVLDRGTVLDGGSAVFAQ